MLKKLYDKSRIGFSVMWIVSYCVFMSLGDLFSEMIGVQKVITLAVGMILSAVLLLFLKRNGLFKCYGLRFSDVPWRAMLYYLPILVMLTVNFLNGITYNYGLLESALYILSMFCVGFLEEVIFRGLLFEAMKENGFKAAVIVSSLSFGIGHIINLVNGSGAMLLPNLLQVIYATAAGFMFVMLYCKTKSMIGCIVAHSIFNALSVFSNESALSLDRQILTCCLLTVISGSYALYIMFTMSSE